MDAYNKLTEELKATIKEANGVPMGSYKYAVLKVKATKLHTELIKMETFIKNSKDKFAA